MSQDLYNIMRPRNFQQLIANCATLPTLLNDARKGTLKHTYLLIGDRGCGKTTTGRIIAKSHDCNGEKKPCGVCKRCVKNETKFGNIIEVNAGQFGKKENAEDLVNSHSTQGLTEGITTIIMDECHNLTKQAKEVFKKPIEEPPAHLRWIFCTDKPFELDEAFLSRCQKHTFDKLTETQAIKLVHSVTMQYNKQFDETCELISGEHAKMLADYSENVPREIINNTELYLSGDRNPESVRMYSANLEEHEDNTYKTLMNLLSKDTSIPKAAAILSKLPDNESYENIRLSIMTTVRKRWLSYRTTEQLQYVKKCAIILDELKTLLAHPKSVNDLSARLLNIKIKLSE